VLLKPILYNLNIDVLKEVVEEWSDLIMDTYRLLKKDQSVRESYGSHSSSASPQKQQLKEFEDHKLINQYFGELEIRGLIALSYFSIYYSNEMDQSISRRVSKLSIILTREIVGKFN